MKNLALGTILALFLSLSCTWLSIPRDEEGIARLELSNGLELLMKEESHKPLVGVHALIQVNSGLPSSSDILKSQLVAALLSKGTKNHPTPLEFQKHLETLQIFLEIKVLGPTISLYLEAPSRERENLVATLIEILTESLLDPTTFAQVKKNMILRQTLVPLSVEQSFLAPSATYTSPSILEAISHNDIVALYKEKFVASNTILTLMGNFNAKRLARFIKKRTGGFQKGTKLSLTPFQLDKDLALSVFPKKENQQLINFSFLGPEVSDIEAPSFILTTFILDRFFSLKAIENNLSFSLEITLLPVHKNLVCTFHVKGLSEDTQKIQKLFFDSAQELQRDGVSQKTYEEALELFKLKYLSKNTYLPSLVQDLSYWHGANDYKKRVLVLSKTSIETHKGVQTSLLKFFKSEINLTNPTPKTAFSVTGKEIDFRIPKKRENHLEQFKLSNGISLLLHTYNDVAFVSGSISFKVGEAPENTIELYLNSLLEGTLTFDTRTFKKEILRLGVSLQPFSKSGVGGFYFSVLKDNLEPLLFLLADTLFSAKLADEGLNRAQKKIEIQSPNIFLNSESAVKTIFFKKRTPENISSQSLKRMHEKTVLGHNLNIVLIGDTTSVNAKKLVEKYFAKAKRKEITKEAEITPETPGLSQESFLLGKLPIQLSTLGLVVPLANDFFYTPDVSLHFLCSEAQAYIPHLINCGVENYTRHTLFLFNFAHEKGEKKLTIKEFLNILKVIKQTELSPDTVQWLEGSSYLLQRSPTFADEALTLALHLHNELPFAVEKTMKLFSKKDLKTILNEQLFPEQYGLGTLLPINN